MVERDYEKMFNFWSGKLKNIKLISYHHVKVTITSLRGNTSRLGQILDYLEDCCQVDPSDKNSSTIYKTILGLATNELPSKHDLPSFNIKDGVVHLF